MTRIPPQDIESERMVLGSMLVDRKCCPFVFDALSEDSFYVPLNRILFSAAKTLFRKNQPIDALSLKLEASKINNDEDLPSYLCEISENITTASNIEYYINNILEQAERRNVIEACGNAVEALFSDPDFKATDITSKLVSQVLKCQRVQSGGIKRIGDFLNTEFDRLEKISNGEKAAFIETGIRAIDEQVFIEKNDLVIIGARPSNGKSSLAGCIARNISKKGGVVFKITLDSTSQKEVSRDLFSEAKINRFNFYQNMACKRDLPKLREAANRILEMNVYIDDPASVTPSQIYAKCLNVIHNAGRLDALILDYIQQADPDEKTRTTRENVTAVSRSLKGLAKMIGCPVIPLSQLSRYENEESEPPRLRHLKESGAIDADADIVLMLWYEGKYDKKKDPALLNIIIEKNKSGYLGTVPVNFFADHFLITDRDETRANDQPSLFQSGGERDNW